MKNTLYVSAVISAGILWGIISLFVRKLSYYGLDPIQIAFVRLFVAAPVFSAAVALIDKNKLKIRFRDIWMFIGMGIISIVLFNFCYFYTMVHSQTSVAVVLLYTSPVFIMLLSALLFKEKITLLKLSALVLTTGGCICVSELKNGSGISLLTIAIGLASGLFYGLYTIFGRFALQKYSPLTVTAYAFIFGLAGSSPLSRPFDALKILFSSYELMLYGLGIGIICTVLPYFLYTWGLSGMESGKAAVLVAVEPLVGAVMGIFVWHDTHSPAKIIGIILILSSLIILNIPIKQTKKSAGPNKTYSK